MDDIDAFLDDFQQKYPSSFLNVDSFVKILLPNESDDPFTFKSKYFVKHIPVESGTKLKFIPKSSASEDQQKKYGKLFELNLIDYKLLLKDFQKDDFDIADWCNNRLEFEWNQIKSFLFDCSFFKGVYFINNLKSVMLSISDSLQKIHKENECNWVQVEMLTELGKNLKYLNEYIDETFGHSLQKTTAFSTFVKRKPKIWYRLAEIMADGTLTQTERDQFLFKGEKLKQSEIVRLIHKELNGEVSVNSINPYLSATKSPNKTSQNTDKNIFHIERLEDLILIGAKAEAEGNLSPYYKEKLSELQKSM